MNISELNNHSPEQLRELAGKMGLHVHHKAGKDTIIKQIVDSTQPKPKQSMEHPAQAPVAPKISTSPEEVDEAIAKIKEAKPAFQAIYPGDGTWIFKFNGAEDSGSLCQPLRTIVAKAHNVARGRIALRSLNNHFGDVPTPGNSVYTNIVLS